MNGFESVRVQCPYCWEMIDILIDCSEEEQNYIEDCQVCCKPININLLIDQQGVPQVTVLHEDE